MEIDDNLFNEINKLNNQLENLKLNMAYDEEVTSEEESEVNEVVFGYESDENPYNETVRVKQEYEHGETSKTTSPFIIDNKQTAYAKRGRTYEKIPYRYQPKFRGAEDRLTLDLDCCANGDDTLQDWVNEYSSLVELNNDIKQLDSRSFLLYIRTATRGNVFQYLCAKETDIIAQISLETDNLTRLNTVASFICKEFFGRSIGEQNHVLQIEKRAMYQLINLEICDMCNLENYACEFSERYYNLPLTKQEEVKDWFFQKLPQSVFEAVSAYFKARLEGGNCEDTLGARIIAARDWKLMECNKEVAKKQAKIKLCCDKQIDPIGKYGCKQPYQKSRKRRKKHKKVFKKTSKRKFKKYPYRKYFRKKNKPERKPDKFCPTGKRKCRCWTCHEEGHVSTNCPKRTQQTIHTLRTIWDNGFVPLEYISDIDKIDEIFVYSTETESSSDEESESE